MFILINDNGHVSSYYLKDKEIIYKGIKIYKKNNYYYISLNNNLFFVDNTKLKKLDNSLYLIKSNSFFYEIKVFVYPKSSGYEEYELYENHNLLIANSLKANLESLDPYIKNYYLSIIDGYVKSNYEFEVNHNRYNNQKLVNGDEIVFQAHHIKYFEDYLYINKFLINNKLKKFDYKPKQIKYVLESNRPSYYIPRSVKDLIIPEVNAYEEVKDLVFLEFIKSLIPNIIMCLCSIAMAFINFYVAFSRDEINLNTYSYLIMPISMFITSIIVPIIFYLVEHHKYKKAINYSINNYMAYLDEYELEVNNLVKEYICICNEHFFSLIDINKMFYAGRTSDDFLTISLGKNVITYEFKYKKTKVEDINNRYLQIQKRLSNIDDVPIFLDLKKSRLNTIISKRSKKNYFFNKFLLELAYKHHFEDVNIAIYAKDNNILNDIYNLPHLFIDKRRLTYNNENDLRLLDQIKLTKPLILLLYDYSDLIFNNDLIKIIYFSIDNVDLLRNSNTIVEYDNNVAYLYQNNKIEFKYIEEQIDLKNHFNYLGKFKSIIENKTHYNFQKVLNGLTIKDYYLNNDKTLKAYFSYHNQELLCLDLHESKHGPHGLIGGSTGSGKSELIISLLLSLCIRYSPLYLNIVLIDYKGGGIKESLSSNNICIPHIVASLSNLENYAFERLIIALNNECKRRQQLFKDLSVYTNKPIMNLDDYLEENNDTYKFDNLTHLLIVVDEFAELKKENPILIKDLISISRIGRSLGIHLILATQKPAGIIDDEIWSNSHFKLALKVFDEKDSLDIIKVKDAANISKPGSFILRIDNSLINGQSIYAKNDINNNDPYIISVLNNSLEKSKSYKLQEHKIYPEINYLCEDIIDTCKKLNIKASPLIYEAPKAKNRKKYYKEKHLVFGQIDDYLNNIDDKLSYDINDNILIYSSRNDEINSILNILNDNKHQTIIIASKEYENSSISDSLTYDMKEDIEYLFSYLLKHNNLTLTLIIEDLNCLLSYDDIYGEYIFKLLRRKNVGKINYIFVTKNAQISFKLSNAFNNKIMIDINDESEISAFFGLKSMYKGNSFFLKEKPISFVPYLIEEFNKEDRILEPLIKHLPDTINAEINEDMCLLGYDLNTKEKVYEKSGLTIVSYDEKLLEVYQKEYKGYFDYVLYNHSICKKPYKSILWLGPGLYMQHLLLSSFKKDLAYNEALYIKDNEQILLRSIINV